MSMEALGMVETRGLTAAIEAADSKRFVKIVDPFFINPVIVIHIQIS